MQSSPHNGLNGKWKSILLMAGYSEKELSGKNVPCPTCGGKDRFRFTDKGEGMFICSHCGGGDGFKLVGMKFGFDFKLSLQWVRECEGMAEKNEVKKVDYEKNRQYINKLLREANHPQGVEKVDDYLRSRHLSEIHATESNVHWHPKCRHKVGTKESYAPAILASYYAVDDMGGLSQLPVTVLRHWYTLGDKMVMPPAGDMSAVVCPLGPRVTDFLAVAEGLYTAMAYREALKFATGHDLPVWSAYSAESLKHFMPPVSVKRLHIVMDVDISFTGQAAAYDLAKGLHAWRPDLNIRVVRPCPNDGCDFDFNDWLRSKRDVQKQQSEAASEVDEQAKV